MQISAFALPNATFAADGIPIVRIRFRPDGSGPASTLIRLYWDGDRFEDARTR